MKARKYTHKFEVWQKGQSTDEYGGIIVDDVLIKSVFANIQTANGSKYKGQFDDFRNPIILRVRKKSLDLKDSTYLKREGITYEVKGVEDKLDSENLILFCDGSGN